MFYITTIGLPWVKKEKKKKSDEASVAAGMPGVSTPLGTGPTYPAKIIKKNKKKRKSK